MFNLIRTEGTPGSVAGRDGGQARTGQSGRSSGHSTRIRRSMAVPPVRTVEYAARGEYHRALDPTLDYYTTYRAKLTFVRRYLDALPAETRVLDAGGGAG